MNIKRIASWAIVLCSVIMSGIAEKQPAININTGEQSADRASLIARGVATKKSPAPDAVQKYVSSLPADKEASQLFLVNINGDSAFVPVETPVPGGYLFFRYNIADSAQGVTDFTASIRTWCKKHNEVPPYTAIDQEGGDVERLRAVAPRLPSAHRVAASYTLDEARSLYETQAKAMHQMGFDLNLAPVAEAANDRNLEVLGTRTFGDADTTMRYGQVCVEAYQSASVATALKHFPCNASTDPHTGKSEVTIAQDALDAELMPFFHLMQCGAEAVLMSHVRVNGLPPACMSSHWVEVLRKTNVNGSPFNGLVISDDIFMAAVADGYTPEEAAVRAVEAGVDIIMISEKRFAKPLAAITARMKEDSTFAARVEESCARVVRFKVRHGILSKEDLNAAK